MPQLVFLAHKRLISRRRLLAIGGAGALTAFAAACGVRQAPAPEPNAGGPLPVSGGPAAGPGLPLSAGSGPAIQEPGAVVPTAHSERPASGPPPPTATTGLLNQVAPESVVSPSPTVVPPTAVPTQVPTAVPTATATPIPYDAKRLTDRLGAAQTSYAGSISERAWNVELAAERLNGTRVPPGGVFSFNEAVGPTTLKAGFRIGYGILIKDDRPETVPSVAGGICQVATTVYQAAMWAGLPFVERHYHLYWIPRYGQPPSGRVGFDATVDDPGVDLKFKNTTGDWIRLDSWVDGSNMGFILKGVDPGWDVEIGKPRVFDPVKADKTVVRQDDPTLPAGRELFVEHAEDGFRVTVNRLVKAQGKIVDDLTYTNYYRPSRNVILVGTKGAKPRPTVSTTPQATPDGTPKAEGTPKADATPKAEATPVAQATKPAPTPTAKPKPSATSAPVPPGQVRVPNLVGLPEAQARKAADEAGLNNTYPNYQGPGDVPPAALQAAPVGSVLSQTPVGGTTVPKGTTIYLAVRKA